uniref:Uncharacterized protein n=1 Tax=Rhizochromulina marina TaxID=1034831 RepID=A0A7S2WCE4_9STRA|mmetsp:Transcript_20578/g.60102  ORF Transcript_20578/g.60102 Transcript_20578/m.60102 type:complete len:126 (+) Transcript_20578:104-481(+)|eukprot:CAMPEP_0118996700 /NCGR_PEP_ID=MMETSP1173-20130426/60539_1 /TAXON_ID=1034831 /ORGANISM="Rhizochromulina marina cf, Strain CCMP1243" /LENGTH=125 /DNA_ID=CAMNT_0006948107 /DNA_START=1 /DNA_END=378 /DNA_ORIENTATION=+
MRRTLLLEQCRSMWLPTAECMSLSGCFGLAYCMSRAIMLWSFPFALALDAAVSFVGTLILLRFLIEWEDDWHGFPEEISLDRQLAPLWPCSCVASVVCVVAMPLWEAAAAVADWGMRSGLAASIP